MFLSDTYYHCGALTVVDGLSERNRMIHFILSVVVMGILIYAFVKEWQKAAAWYRAFRRWWDKSKD